MAGIVKKEQTSLEIALTDNSWSTYLTQVLGENKKQFVNDMLCMVANDNLLAQCNPQELVNAGLQATTLGLSLNKSLGRAYVIPYKDKSGAYHPQFQVAYKGFVELAVSSGVYKHINVTEIMDPLELKNKDFLNGDSYAKIKVTEWRKRNNKTQVIGYCARIVENSGFEHELFMSKEQIEAHAKEFSQSYKYDKYGTSLWSKSPDKMGCKTVLKLLLNQYGRTSNRNLNLAIASDQAVIKDFSNQKYDYIDNKTEDAVAEVIEEPKCKYATQEEAVARFKLLFESNVFTDEEKERFRKLWSNEWKQAISEADEAYAMKSEAMQSVS